MNVYIDGLVPERRNSSALAIELRLSCTNPLIWPYSEWIVSDYQPFLSDLLGNLNIKEIFLLLLSFFFYLG